MIEQNTEAWHAARLGRVTASRIADLTSKTKSGWGAGRKNYMAQLVAEKLTGEYQAGWVSAEMQWGTDHEHEAISAYEYREDVDVARCGFEVHHKIERSGCSPDGLVGKAGLIEVKCPNTATHIDTLLTHKIPDKYYKQMLWQMACTKRKWCDYLSYDPRMPPEMQVWMHRVMWDKEKINILETQVEEFLTELEQTVSKLTAEYGMGG